MDFTAEIVHYVKDGNKPITKNISAAGVASAMERSGIRISKKVIIKDGRTTNLTLDNNSFQLVNWDTKLKREDFYDDEKKVKTVYFREMEDCVKKFTGAERVKCLSYQVRNAKKATSTEGNIQNYSFTAHVDVTPASAKAYFADHVKDLDPNFSHGRFIYINVWRNVSNEPIRNHHLALLDFRSLTQGIGSEDYVEAEYYGPESSLNESSVIPDFRLNEKNSESHSWFYFHSMTKNEVLLFKQFDSDEKQPARVCFHTAVVNPTVDLSPTRESIEVRAIAFFPAA